MILECVKGKGWNLSRDPAGLIPEGSNYRGLYFTAQSVFHLTVAKKYRAHGLALFNGAMIALVIDDETLPCWYPAEAFVVVDGTMPHNWRFGLRDQDGATGLQAIWGYPKLVDDPNHISSLAELDSSALAEFFELVGRSGPTNSRT